MEGLQVTMILAIFLVLLSGHVHSVVVNKADEDRAIAMVNQMIQRLEQDRSNPPRVINVSRHHILISSVVQLGMKTIFVTANHG